MIHFLALLSILLLLTGSVYYIKNHDRFSDKQKKKYVWILIIGAILVLVVLGKAHWLTALIAASVGLIRFLFPLIIRHLPELGAFYTAKRQSQGPADQKRVAEKSTLSKEEACDILGVDPDASEEEILTAYKRLMQKCHPDRGGTDYLAAQLNDAKKVLLSGKYRA